MIHHPIILGTKVALLLVITIILVILHGILPPEQFKIAVEIGAAAFVLSVFMIWTAFFMMLKNPNSRLSKSIVLTTAFEENPQEKIREKEKMDSLIGTEGIAESNLRPSGIGRFKDNLVDVVSDRLFVTKGEKIKVIGVEGKKLKVCKSET